MKALILPVNRATWSTTKGYELSNVPAPVLDEKRDPEDAHRVLIEPIYAGVCGTDKGIWFRKAFRDSILHHLEADKRDYFVMGHELLGRIVELGSEAKRLGRVHVGQVVSAESHIFCGKCPMCLAGNQHVCANERIIGVTWDGVFAERVKLPENVLWPTVLEKVRPEIAAIQEPFGNAVHVCTPNMTSSDLRHAEMRGKSVAVFGCGTIGLFSILIARAMGAKKIIGIEPNPANKAKAKACGADEVIDPSDHSAAHIRALTEGYGADYTLEMSGFPSSLVQAIQGARRGGNIVLFGLSSGDVTVPRFEELITAGKRIHAIVGRRVFSTWELTKQLLEDRGNGIQDAVWKHVLDEGKGTILPLSEFTSERFEQNLLEHPKTLIQISSPNA
ncbi:MAG: alcohol dehydrogenase catalytic domain-containing protein [Bacteriovoracia bacterium]